MLLRLLAAVTLGLVLAGALRPAALSDDRPDIVVRLGLSEQIHLRVNHGVWRSWIAGAPYFVNGRFLEFYERADTYRPPQPTPVPTPPPAALPPLSWWTIDGATATLTANPPGNDDFTLTLSWTPTLSMGLSFDHDSRGRARPLVPSEAAREIDAGVYEWPPAGSIFVRVTNGEPVADGTPYTAIGRREWWPLSPDHRTAYAPAPLAMIDYLRGADGFHVGAHERGSYHNVFAGSATGQAPLRGLDQVLARLSCVE